MLIGAKIDIIEKGVDNMKLDFVKEVEQRKEAILKDLTGLIQINSELTTFDEKRARTFW